MPESTKKFKTFLSNNEHQQDMVSAKVNIAIWQKTEIKTEQIKKFKQIKKATEQRISTNKLSKNAQCSCLAVKQLKEKESILIKAKQLFELKRNNPLYAHTKVKQMQAILDKHQLNNKQQSTKKKQYENNAHYTKKESL